MSPAVYRSSVALALLVLVLGTPGGLAQSPPATSSKALSPGQASGTFVANGKTYAIVHAAAFVDQRDDRKPVVLLLTDKPMPAEVLSGGVSLMMHRMSHSFNGVAFYLDQKRTVFRCDYYEGDFPTSVSGLLDLKLNDAAGTSFAGSAQSNAAARSQTPPLALDVVFNATVK